MTLPHLAMILALVAPQGGWRVGDVFVYSNGCRTEEAITSAAEFFAYEPAAPYINIECFAMRQLIPMRLVRAVGEFPTASGEVIYAWEIYDVMRDKAFTLLPPRAQMVSEPEATI